MVSRYYSFSLTSYHTLQQIQDFCSTTSKYAYAFHDKDPCEPHFHILCVFKQNLSFTQIKNKMPDTANIFIEPLHDRFAAFRYLTHKDNPDKYQYPDSIVQTNALSYFSEKDSKQIDVDTLLTDLSPYSVLTLRELAVKYGRDFIKNYSSYKDYAKKVHIQENCIERGYAENIELLSYTRFLDDLYFSLNTIFSYKKLNFFDTDP